MFPTIGPVRQESGGPGSRHLELSASTNCAEVGEVITFTITMTNEMEVPMTLADTHRLDIVLKPSGGVGPTQRWSATSQYPTTINPVLAPYETRTYHWRWKADAVYAQVQQTDFTGVFAQFTSSEFLPKGYAPLPGGSVEVYVGVGAHILPQPGTNVPCTEMRR